MILTTAILIANSFLLDSNSLYTNGDYSVDAAFHLIYDEEAFPISTTVADLQTHLDDLVSGITLV